MTRPRPSYTPTPRIYDENQTCARLNKGAEWWRKNRDRLEALGFPQVDKLLGGRDADAIELWLDKRSGIFAGDNDDMDNGLMKRLEAMR